MKSLRRLLFTLLVLTGANGVVGVVQAQNPPQPDCIFTINNLTTAGNTGVFDNRFIGCDAWTLVYQSSGFSGLSLTFQSATGATVATIGAWGTYTGTVVTGVNPNTDTTGRITQFSNGLVITPWVRVNLAGLMGAGTVNGTVYGYKTGYSSGNGGGGGTACPGTAGTPCVVDGPDTPSASPTHNPVLVAGIDAGFSRIRYLPISTLAGNAYVQVVEAGTTTALSDASTNSPNRPQADDGLGPAGGDTFPVYPFLFNGTTWDREITCSSTVIVDDSTSGTVQQIALSGTNKIRLCKMTLTTAAGVNVQLVYGTGVNCGTGTANLTGLYQTASTIAEDWVADRSALTTPAGQAVCLVLGGATRTTGTISYAQFN